ncbi:MAG TPA: VWA domain-containing protein [Terriglobales bacterium]|nr:VWA domain-containing protein [Terriglobales bacterium]
MRRWMKGYAVVALLVALAWMAFAQTDPQQTIPDAPSATKPQANPFPADAPKAPANSRESRSTPTKPNEPPVNTPAPDATQDVPGAGEVGGREQMYTLSVTTNQVFVPVTVRDSDGRRVEGLTVRDFSVYEDGIRQPINFFTSDPFPLSVAVLVDIGMPDVEMRKVNETLPNIVSAFSQYDEVSMYTYGNSVSRVIDFSAVNEKLSAGIKRARKPGRSGGGVAMAGGPMSAGPSVNGHPIDPNTPVMNTPRMESRVLNDAILLAGQDLSRRPRDRRKIIFVISDGREQGSRARYDDVRKVLLSNDVTVYAINVGDSALPGYDTLSRVHIPYSSYQNLLPRYVRDTGGQIYQEFGREAIENAYSGVTEVARNQYTLGYKTKNAVAGNYRSIEVRVHRGGLRISARDGYYPLPPPRPQAQ